MNEITEEVRKLIEKKYHITEENRNSIYFGYSKQRGYPSFRYEKRTRNVVRMDRVDHSRNSMIAVEVKTTIYSLMEEGISPVDAQEIFLHRHTEVMKSLLNQYGGIDIN
ncbi:hypothetical protein CN507_17800 [Bacillus cereus]|nr:hypothetical protein CN507_17800 [Bacillus cereus]